jgi:glutaryl-CoA dehydrogenase
MDPFSDSDFYEIDELLTPQDKQIRTQVCEWVGRRFMPLVREHYRAGTFPMELVSEMAQLNCFGASIKGYGCAGLTNLQYGLIMQELERGDSGLRTFASVHGALAMNAIHMFGSEEQKDRWLPAMARGEKLGCFGLTEPDFGSNPAGMVTTARKTRDGYMLNGKKMWIGNGSLADVAVVFAKVDGIDGVDPTSQAAIRAFLVEKHFKGFRADVIEGKLSLRAAITSRLYFDDCQLPDGALLPKSSGLKSALMCLNHARYGIAWGAVGSAMACFDEARQYALERVQFGRPIARFPLKDAGKVTPQQISMAKRNNVNTAIEIARTARDILGGVGILDEYQCFRHVNNLESVKTYEGTDDMHLLILGEKITGIAAFE